MYRDSLETIARELQTVQSENERLRAELAMVELLSARPRWMRLICGFALVAASVVACGSALGYGREAMDASARKELDDKCRATLADKSYELAHVSTRLHDCLAAPRELGRLAPLGCCDFCGGTRPAQDLAP